MSLGVSLNLTLLIRRMGATVPTSQGVLRIAEIPYVKCLTSDLADSECSLVELGSNWEDLGRLLGGGRDTS